MGVCDDGDKAGGADDGATGAATEAISGEFKSQEVANTKLWSTCFFFMFCSDLETVFLSSLVSVASRLVSQFFAGLDSQHLRQVHQFFIACDIEEILGMRLPASIYALKANNSEKQKNCEPFS